MASKSPTQRTLAALKAEGYECAIVEKFNHWAGPHGVRQDAFGAIDILALCRSGLRPLLGVQSTGQDFAGHYRKLTEERRRVCLLWLLSGAELQLWGWRRVKAKRGSKRVVWRPRVHAFTLEDFIGGEEVLV